MFPNTTIVNSFGNQTQETEIFTNELIRRYQLADIIKWINENNYEKTCLQFPEELLNDGTSIALYLQDVLGRDVYILGDTSYGSCCVDEVGAEHINGDSIIHFGHACLSPVVKLPVYYVFLREDLNLDVLSSKFEIFKENDTVIVFYDDVYHHLHYEITNILKDRKNIYVSRLNTTHNENCNGKVLCGRIFTLDLNENVSAVFLGSENSRTLENLVLNLPGLKWYVYDSTSNEMNKYQTSSNKFLMKRMALVEKVKLASTIGILIGTLGIKNYLDAIERIKLLVKRSGKKCYKLAVGKPNVAKLANFPEIDVFVFIACQENLLLKDSAGYYKPIVSLFEIEMALGSRPYSTEYTSDFRELLPGGFFYTQPDDKIESHQNLELNSLKQNTQELTERCAGTIVESSGAQFLMTRTWQGLEQRIGETDVERAVQGRSGIPQAYANEWTTLSDKK